MKTNRVEYNWGGRGGGGLVGTWVAELMRHVSKMFQYLRIGALLKRVTPEVLAIRQSWNYNKIPFSHNSHNLVQLFFYSCISKWRWLTTHPPPPHICPGRIINIQQTLAIWVIFQLISFIAFFSKQNFARWRKAFRQSHFVNKMAFCLALYIPVT